MEKIFEKVATENANPLIDAMVKNYINDFWGKPENELDLAKVHKYIELVDVLNTTTHINFENDLLAIMSINLFDVSTYMNVLINWDIMPMANDDDLKREFENRVSDWLYNIKSAIKTYVTKRDKICN